MIIGIGADILSYKRIEGVYKRLGEKFVKRILAKSEIKQFNELSELKKISFLAKRFAAKEAVSKALGLGIGTKLSFQDIEIRNNNKGKPIAEVKKFGDIKIHISLSDEKEEFITAFSIAEKIS